MEADQGLQGGVLAMKMDGTLYILTVVLLHSSMDRRHTKEQGTAVCLKPCSSASSSQKMLAKEMLVMQHGGQPQKGCHVASEPLGGFGSYKCSNPLHSGYGLASPGQAGISLSLSSLVMLSFTPSQPTRSHPLGPRGTQH